MSKLYLGGMTVKKQTKVQWVASKLRDLRISRGLTLQQVATRLGQKSHSRVSDYESVRYIPNLANLFELLAALGTTPNDFFKDMPDLRDVGEPTRSSRSAT